jgi:hypothetical protein
MKTLKLLSCLLVLLFAGIVSAQSNGVALNWKGWDTCNITKFCYDTFRLSKPMNFTNAENKLLILVYDDTMNAGRASDSLNCEIGYQIGAPIISLTGKNDTSWTACIVLDTINTLTASKAYNPSAYGVAANWALDRTMEQSIRVGGQIDTTIGTTSSAITIPILPFWAPYVRFYVKGLTSNAHTFIRAKFVFEQRGYVNVRNQ